MSFLMKMALVFIFLIMFLNFALHWKEVLSSLLCLLRREAERMMVPMKTITKLPSIRVCSFPTAKLIYDLGKCTCTLKNLRPSFLTVFIYPCLSLRGDFDAYVRRGRRYLSEIMHIEALRLKSFSGIDINNSPLRLAAAGFYATGDEDEARCYSCGIRYRNWRRQDQPLNVQHNRGCRHRYGNAWSNVSFQARPLPCVDVQPADDREMHEDHDIHPRLPEVCAASKPAPSRDEILVWKITDYMRRKAEEPCLCSQPFYTSHNGYKMQAVVYLNGYGAGHRTHFSFFLVLLKGEYDHLLPWPFQQRITFHLLNQGQSQGHHGECILPNPNLPSYQRPQSEMNMATGCPLFVSQADLENLNNGYLVNDSIFVKVFIDIQTENTGHR